MDFFYSKEMVLLSLATLGSIASFDEIYFHQKKNKMLTQEELYDRKLSPSYKIIYFSVIFILVSSFSLNGAWAILVLFLFL